MSDDGRKWVRMFAAERGPGQYRVRCPSCDGGRSRETSLVVTIGNHCDAQWICHRASCSEKGSTANASPVVQFQLPEARQSKIKPYFGELYPLEAADLRYFKGRFGILPEVSSLYIRHNETAYVLPIYDRYGRVRGHVERQPVWKGKILAPRPGVEGHPKARTWPLDDTPTQSWYYPDPDETDWMASRTVVIVEDQISAIKASQAGYIGLALLGTHLNGDRIREIQQESPLRTVLALDNDAEGLAVKLAQKWAVALPGFEIKLLRADLKDVPDVREEVG